MRCRPYKGDGAGVSVCRAFVECGVWRCDEDQLGIAPHARSDFGSEVLCGSWQ